MYLHKYLTEKYKTDYLVRFCSHDISKHLKEFNNVEFKGAYILCSGAKDGSGKIRVVQV